MAQRVEGLIDSVHISQLRDICFHSDRVQVDIQMGIALSYWKAISNNYCEMAAFMDYLPAEGDELSSSGIQRLMGLIDSVHVSQ